MLGAALHKTLRRWFFRVPTHNISSMRLLALIDVVFIIAVPLPVWLTTISSLRMFKRRLTVQQWPSLAEIYPRSLMWTYIYLMFWWARYCDVLPTMCASPDRALLAEMFIRYVCAIDTYVDSWDSAPLWRDHPAQPKRMAEPREIARQMGLHLDRLKVSPPTRLTFLRLMAEYRMAAQGAMHRWATAPANALSNIVEAKERTAGDMWRCWARLLGCLYEVPAPVTQTASDNLFWFGMGLQVVDDVTDFPVDYALGAQNFLVSMIREQDTEEQKVKAHIDGKQAAMLDAGWAKEHIPGSYKAALEIYYSYSKKLLDDRHKPALVRELYRTLESFRRMQG